MPFLFVMERRELRALGIMRPRFLITLSCHLLLDAFLHSVIQDPLAVRRYRPTTSLVPPDHSYPGVTLFAPLQGDLIGRSELSRQTRYRYFLS
jgi:hypothetical protein